MCPAYTAGLTGPRDRKRVQPIAASDGEVSYDRLHHFVCNGVWDEASLVAGCLAEADRQVGGDEAWLFIDVHVGCERTGPSPRSHWPRLQGSVTLASASTVSVPIRLPSFRIFPEGLEQPRPRLDGWHPARAEVFPRRCPQGLSHRRAGKARNNMTPDATSQSARSTLDAKQWRHVGWRRGIKGKLLARFAEVRLRIGDRPPQSIHDMSARHLPGEQL